MLKLVENVSRPGASSERRRDDLSALAEAAQIGHDDLEAGGGKGFDHLPEHALALGPTVHAEQRHAAHPFAQERLREATRRRGVHEEAAGVDVRVHTR